MSQSGRSLPGQSPARFGVTIALDLSSALERDPQIDLARYVHDQYAQYTHPFFVMLADDTVITSGSATVAEPLLGMARHAAALGRAAAAAGAASGQTALASIVPSPVRPMAAKAPGRGGRAGISLRPRR